MTSIFTSNWHIYKCCLPTQTQESETERSKNERLNNLTQTEIFNESSLLEEADIPVKGFDRLLLEAVDEAFSALGYSTKKTLYYYLEKKYNIAMTDIPYKTEEFTKALEKFLGSGAKLIQIRIMEGLYKKLKKGKQTKNFENTVIQENLVFPEYIVVLRALYNNH